MDNSTPQYINYPRRDIIYISIVFDQYLEGDTAGDVL